MPSHYDKSYSGANRVCLHMASLDVTGTNNKFLLMSKMRNLKRRKMTVRRNGTVSIFNVKHSFYKQFCDRDKSNER